MSRDIFCCHTGEGELLTRRGHPTTYRTLRHNKELSKQKYLGCGGSETLAYTDKYSKTPFIQNEKDLKLQ